MGKSELSVNAMSPTEHLKWALQALAQPFQTQIGLFPAFVCVPDELVLDFDERYRRACAAHHFTPEQLKALNDLNSAIEKESGPTHIEFWTETAMQMDPRWERFRELARLALEAFDWPIAIPPDNRAIYITNNDA